MSIYCKHSNCRLPSSVELSVPPPPSPPSSVVGNDEYYVNMRLVIGCPDNHAQLSSVSALDTMVSVPVSNLKKCLECCDQSGLWALDKDISENAALASRSKLGISMLPMALNPEMPRSIPVVTAIPEALKADMSRSSTVGVAFAADAASPAATWLPDWPRVSDIGIAAAASPPTAKYPDRRVRPVSAAAAASASPSLAVLEPDRPRFDAVGIAAIFLPGGLLPERPRVSAVGMVTAPPVAASVPEVSCGALAPCIEEKGLVPSLGGFCMPSSELSGPKSEKQPEMLDIVDMPLSNPGISGPKESARPVEVWGRATPFRMAVLALTVGVAISFSTPPDCS
mmetsp:Transcript_35218/g.105202  ORF Transcript_35218/g.105202 Transcript_35218/m.105202 type:complete len:339 (+) Transcript_35218:562-1578(+)